MTDPVSDEFAAAIAERAALIAEVVALYADVQYAATLTPQDVARLREQFVFVIPSHQEGVFLSEKIDPHPATTVLGHSGTKFGKKTGLEVAGTFRTLHTWDNIPVLFKGSAAEVYAQMPDEFKNDESLVAFHVAYPFKHAPEILFVPRPEYAKGYHPGLVTVYRKAPKAPR